MKNVPTISTVHEKIKIEINIFDQIQHSLFVLTLFPYLILIKVSLIYNQLQREHTEANEK